jgi:N-methylhydantoinase B/oxoprolinase/acetone carboxylase alpha subunit
MNRQEAFRVNQLEAKIRNRKTEKGYVIDSNGRVIGESINGTAHRAKFRVTAFKKDAILTHNHPTEGANSGLYGTMAGRIGVPFSAQDVKNAIQFDLKEVRAVTPTYTYSIRRPKGGWGDARTAINALNKYQINSHYYAHDYAQRQLRVETRNGSLTRQRAREISDRANVGAQYSEFKKMAKQLGWTFTRKRAK